MFKLNIRFVNVVFDYPKLSGPAHARLRKSSDNRGTNFQSLIYDLNPALHLVFEIIFISISSVRPVHRFRTLFLVWWLRIWWMKIALKLFRVYTHLFRNLNLKFSFNHGQFDALAAYFFSSDNQGYIYIYIW